MLAEQAVLLEHEQSPSHLRRTGHKMVVPEQRHLFTERVQRMQNCVEPPAAQLIDVVLARDALADIVQKVGALISARRSVENAFKRGTITVAHRLAQLFEVGPEA